MTTTGFAPGDTPTDALVAYLVRRWFKSPNACRTYFRTFFGTTPLRGRVVLDVGAGKGWLSLYAASEGAAHVIGLEPCLEGGKRPDMNVFLEGIERLNLRERVTPLACRFQDFDGAGHGFDLVLMRSVINHLDEEACMAARTSREARERYMRIFRKLNRMMPLGGKLIATDVSPRNLFGDLGVRNPLAPTIDWTKHQPPQLWIALLEACGFGEAKVSRCPPGPLRRFGRLAGNPLGSYVLNSRFRFVVEKIAEVEPERAIH